MFWLCDKAPTPKTGFPAYPAGDPALVKKINNFLRQPNHELTWEFRNLTTRPHAADGHVLCEPSPPWKLADGTWVKLYRDLGKLRSKRNYVSFNFGNSPCWTAAVRTNFPDACSRANAGTLPDGRVYVISNINPNGRDPLAISLSRDGLNFDQVMLLRSGAPPQRHPGRWKGPGFQYPHSVVVGDALWVIYSVNKEDMQVTRVPWRTLGNDKRGRESFQAPQPRPRPMGLPLDAP